MYSCDAVLGGSSVYIMCCSYCLHSKDVDKMNKKQKQKQWRTDMAFAVDGVSLCPMDTRPKYPSTGPIQWQRARVLLSSKAGGWEWSGQCLLCGM